MNYSGNMNINIKEKNNNASNNDTSNNDTSNNDTSNNDTSKTSPQKKQKLEIIIDKKKSNKCYCAECNKKLKLTDIKCRCNKYFCSIHRYSDTHDCSFDYKNLGKILLTKQNPCIISKKIDKF